jgi:Immunity protein 26
VSEPNFEVLTPSRKKLVPGDIFVMRYPHIGYLFGRVIFVDLPEKRAPLPGSNLIYVYRERSPIPDPAGLCLVREKLLVPPMFINRLPWSRGYFQTVRQAPLQADDILERHCFDATVFRKILFVDQNYVALDEPFEPCGVWGLESFLTVDDIVSAALGIPRAPD